MRNGANLEQGGDLESQVPGRTNANFEMDMAAAEESMNGINTMERAIRHAFARKVLALLAVQILVMMAVLCIFVYVPEVRSFAMSSESTWLLVASGFVFLLVVIALSCIPELNRKYPRNIIGLFLLSISAGVFIGFLSAGVTPEYIWIAFASACGIFLALGLFACQTRIDFTGLGPYLLVAVVVLLVFSIFGGVSLTIRSEFDKGIRNIIWVAFALLVFGLYVVYDMQLVVGGKHRLQFGVDDYVLGTIALFTDFIVIFSLVLGLAGGTSQ